MREAIGSARKLLHAVSDVKVSNGRLVHPGLARLLVRNAVVSQIFNKHPGMGGRVLCYIRHGLAES
jgi:hypothetical protein